jgi:hypothetical protein
MAHFKAIFDGINEAIDLHRPFGRSGLPMPWSQQTLPLTPFLVNQNNVVRMIFLLSF